MPRQGRNFAFGEVRLTFGWHHGCYKLREIVHVAQNCRRKAAAGFSLIDNLVAVAIVTGTFTALYAMSAQCSYVLKSGRETTSAQQVLQDRIEQLRNLQWSQATDPNYLVNNVLNQASANGATLPKLSETITVNTYPTALSPAIQVTRTAGTATVVSSNSLVANGVLARIDVTENWTAAHCGRARAASLSTIISVNTR